MKRKAFLIATVLGFLFISLFSAATPANAAVNIVLSNMRLDKSYYVLGDGINLIITATNTGTTSGTKTVTISGAWSASKSTGTLAAGASANVTFTTKATSVGNWVVNCGTMSVTIIVKTSSTSDDSDPGDTTSSDSSYGAGTKYNGNWIGGLTNASVSGTPSYSGGISISSAHYLVSTKSALLSALSSATSGKIIFITANIDMGSTGITIPAGVTLAGNRGQGGSYGPLLSSTASTFITTSSSGNVRITGLRLQGPSSSTTGSGSGIIVKGPGNAIYNCEIYNFPTLGIDVPPGSNNYCHIHHNYIHHNRKTGLGYGVAVLNGNALIEANYFDANRHSIMGQRSNPDGTLSGYAPFSRYNTNYEARYNIVGPNQTNTPFDCHGGNDTTYGGWGPFPYGMANSFAGGTIIIHHNTFLYGGRNIAVGIRGLPQNSVTVYKNKTSWKASEKSVYSQLINNIVNHSNVAPTATSSYQRMEVFDNDYAGSVY